MSYRKYAGIFFLDIFSRGTVQSKAATIFAMLPDLERKSGKGIYKSLIFTNAGNKQGKIFHGATILKNTL